MRHHTRRTICRAMLLLLANLPTGTATGQLKGNSPDDLISILTSRSVGELSLGCGMFSKYRSAAASLANAGPSVLPKIEKVLDSIEERGLHSPFVAGAGWMVNIYGCIRGRAAYPRLRRMIENPELAFFRRDLDDAIAQAFGLTSYVSASNVMLPVLDCNHPLEPRSV
jgi:hypothetical protein